MKSFFAIIVLLLGISVTQAIPNTFNGSWIGVWRNSVRVDEFGGVMTTCVEGTSLQGTFSAIGYITGTISGRNVTGTWKIGGYTQYVYGGFQWSLNDDNKGFTGIMWYDGLPCQTYPWNSTRLEDLSNSACQPLTTDTSLSLEGHWQAGNDDFGIDDLWICINDKDETQFYGSYELDPRGIQAFTWGRVFDKGVSGQASYYDNNEVEGIGILKMTGKDSMVTYQYNQPYYSAAFADYYSPNVNRRALNWTRVGKSSDTTCNKHKDNLPFSWDGAWTFPPAGDAAVFYLCTSQDNHAWGVFAEYGYIDGIVKGNTISGSFYNSGSCESCQGTFNYTLDPTFQQFTAKYTYDGKNIFSFTSKRIDASELAVSGCNTLPGGASNLQGRWNIDANNLLDICLTPDNDDPTVGTVEASYTINGNPHYAFGTYNQNGQATQFNYRNEIDYGVGIARMTGTKSLVSYTWVVSGPNVFTIDPDEFIPCFNSTVNVKYITDHRALVESYETTTSRNLCRRFSYLKDAELVPSRETVTAGASSLSVSFFVLAIVFAFFF